MIANDFIMEGQQSEFLYFPILFYDEVLEILGLGSFEGLRDSLSLSPRIAFLHVLPYVAQFYALKKYNGIIDIFSCIEH